MWIDKIHKLARPIILVIFMIFVWALTKTETDFKTIAAIAGIVQAPITTYFGLKGIGKVNE